MGPNVICIASSSTASSGQGTLYTDATCDTSDNMFYHETTNTPEEIELPDIPTPKQMFEREPVNFQPNFQPKKRTFDVRSKSKKFTQARVRR